jgi:glucosamine--fructose-6-phosphate aminotransferase (isomerizing)
VDESSQIFKCHNIIGIAHTCWATHSGKTNKNAHPHTDSSSKIALVNKGTIKNCSQLHKELQGHGHIFTSQMDTKVIAKLISKYYTKNGNKNLKKAVEQVFAWFNGSWGLCIMCTNHPNQLIVTRNVSPLVIGIGPDHTFISSETSAFNRYAKNYISMNDG